MLDPVPTKDLGLGRTAPAHCDHDGSPAGCAECPGRVTRDRGLARAFTGPDDRQRWFGGQLGSARRGETEIGALVGHPVPQGDRRHLMTAPVVEHGLVGEIDDHLGLQLVNGLGQSRPGVGGGAHLGPSDRGQALGPELLGATGHYRPQYLVAGSPVRLKGPFHHGGIVLSVDYYNAANPDFLPTRKLGRVGDGDI